MVKDLATGTYEIKTVLKDLWGNDVTSTLEGVKYANYTSNILESIYELEDTSTLIDGTYTVDTSVSHSGNGSLRVDDKPIGDLWLSFKGNFEYGKDYALSYWVKSSPQSIARPLVAAKWYEYKDGSLIFYGGPNYMNIYLENSGDWQFVTETISFTHGDTEHYGGDENIHDHTTDTITLEEAKVWFGVWSTYSEAGEEITTEPTVDHIWYDQITIREIPSAGEMLTALEKSTYSQASDGSIEIEFTYNSANVLDYREHVTVDGVETPAQITHSIVNGKTVVKVKFASGVLPIGSHTVTLTDLKDIWNRDISDSSISVYALDHTVNLLADTYECDELSLFTNQWAWQSPGGSISTDVYYSGGSSLMVYSKEFCELNVPAQKIVPKNNTKYQYSFMMKTDGIASRLYIYRNYYCGESNTVKQFASVANLELTTDWQRVTLEFTDAIPETLGDINELMIFATPIGGDTEVRPYYIDCMSLRSMPEDDASLFTLDIGERSSDTNVRFAEINGIRTQIEENANTHSVPVGDSNLLIEIVEKTSTDTSEIVKSAYYFVDATAKTATKLDMDSYMTTDGKKSIRIKEPKGIRFKYAALTSAKAEEEEFVIDEIGFIVAVTDMLGEEELTLDFSKYVKGVAYNKADNTDIVFDRSDDNVDVFTCVVKNIPVSKYKTNLTCKTYTKITVSGEQFTVYGEAVTGNVYDTAQKHLETDPDNADLIKIVLDADYSIGVDVGSLYD